MVFFDHELHDAVGINIQFINGEFSRIRKLILLKMELLLPEDEWPGAFPEKPVRQETVAKLKVLVADLEDKTLLVT